MEELTFEIQTRFGERMISMNSTLVETVSINYEDFNESFLTCGTCLCVYDGDTHTPKLLQCSHTVCLHCLTRIAASQTRDTGSFRCPICRELITIPRGGVSALPPSFLVNQLLDLMSRQRREVIPKCSVHINQELLFCETCDTVFCTLCTGGSHSNSSDNSTSTNSNCNEHTIIPFSIAIKRMSEILLYKANECISKLTQAQESVTTELTKLNDAKDRCIEQIEKTFERIQETIDKRKQEMIEQVKQMCNEKKKVLDEQNELIENEKNKVEQECQGLQYQVEVRNITQKIEILTEKLDTAFSLGEPRENSFLTCNFGLNDSFEQIQQHLGILGKVQTSTTFPSLCTAHLDGNAITGLTNSVTVTTVDYHGNPRKNGGDPIDAVIVPVTTDELVVSSSAANTMSPSSTSIPVTITDSDDGTYKLTFEVYKSGRYGLKISALGRPIKDNPLYFDVIDHNNPTEIYGSRGSGKDEFNLPVAVAIDETNQFIYILDTGNSRIKVLNEHLEFIKHITNDGLLGRSCTGLSLSNNNSIIIVNWRTKFITELTTDGETIKSFTNNALQEPIDIAIDNNYGHILIADNGMNCVFVFDADGKMLFQVGKKGTFSLISAVAVGPAGEIFVADSRVQMFSAKGDFMEIVYDEGRNGKGRYGGIILDEKTNKILASRTEQKGRSYLQVIRLNDKSINQQIDSYDAKLKRPSGLAVTNDGHVIAVDLGNNCIKKFRYC